MTYSLGEDLPYLLYCRVEDISKSSWRRGDKPISVGERTFDTRISISSTNPRDCNLKITKMSKTDEGNYSCREGGNEIISYNLIASESASIPVHSGPIKTSMLGETVSLWCNATGYPTPNVTWYAYRQTGSEEKLENIGITGKMLGIRNASRSCSTKYQCQAMNGYRMKKPAVMNITLTVHSFPDVFLRNKIDEKEILNAGPLPAKKRERVALSCLVYAVPPANVTWSRDNIAIGTYHHINGIVEKSKNNNTFLYDLKTKAIEVKIGISVMLEFTLDAEDTFASYHCDAENEVGSTRKTVKIKNG